MKNFIVTLNFFGLTGEYRSQVEVRAKDSKSASKKAEKVIGNRDGYVVSVVGATPFDNAEQDMNTLIDFASGK